jgi:short subunit dehydrogenase
MARIFISGSSTGLGLMAGQLLVAQGHRVVLHARTGKRADDARRALPQAEAVVTGDLATIAAAKDLAAQAKALGRFDAVIHNAGVGYQEPCRLTADGLPQVFAVNMLATYILTALIERPKRLVYLSSGMQPACRCQSRGHSLAQAALEWIDGVRGEQAARRHAGFRYCAPLARGAVQCRKARPGCNQDGRPRRVGRLAAGARHPDLACREQRSGCAHDGRLLLSSQAAAAEPADRRCRASGNASRHLPGALGRGYEMTGRMGC